MDDVFVSTVRWDAIFDLLGMIVYLAVFTFTMWYFNDPDDSFEDNGILYVLTGVIGGIISLVAIVCLFSYSTYHPIFDPEGYIVFMEWKGSLGK